MIALTLIFLLFASPAMAGQWSLGVSGGWADSLIDGRFSDDAKLGELAAVYAFEKPLIDGPFKINVELEGTAGILSLNTKRAAVFSASPVLRVSLFEKVSATLQIGLGAMSRSEFVLLDLGGPIFYRMGPGLWWHITDRVMVGYRLIHQSNGYMFSRNDGLNFHLATLRWRLGK